MSVVDSMVLEKKIWGSVTYATWDFSNNIKSLNIVVKVNNIVKNIVV